MDKLCWGIVTFNPEVREFSHNLSQMLEYGIPVIIFDNGSDNKNEIEPLIRGNKQITFINNDKNEGIAFGLNRIMEIAKLHQIQWVVSMDQDASLSDNCIQLYQQAISKFNNQNVGAFCPAIEQRDNARNLLFKTESEGKTGYSSVLRCPTSGFCLNTDVWSESGKYEEKLFIDYVDYDLCQKLINSGKKIIRIHKIILTQNLGNTEVVKIPVINKEILVYNHSPFRNYFYVRNSLYFINRYRENINVKKEISKLIKWEIKKIIFEGKKMSQIKAIFKGINDSKKLGN